MSARHLLVKQCNNTLRIQPVHCNLLAILEMKWYQVTRLFGIGGTQTAANYQQY